MYCLPQVDLSREAANLQRFNQNFKRARAVSTARTAEDAARALQQQWHNQQHREDSTTAGLKGPAGTSSTRSKKAGQQQQQTASIGSRKHS
jgi:hypothetical protein